MKDIIYNENTHELDVPFPLLAKEISYAESKKFDQLKLINPAKASAANPDLSPLINNDTIVSFYIINLLMMWN